MSNSVNNLTMLNVNLLAAAYVKVISLARATDGELIDLQRRLSNTDRNRLALFPAGTDACIKAKVIADHRYFCECLGAVTN